MRIRTYSELIRHVSFEDRYNYLRLAGEVGAMTFGFERYLNQGFYRSTEWKRARRDVIARDMGCDLAVVDREVHSRLIVHHMNPMTAQDIDDFSDDILNPEFLITTSHDTHNAIHYGTVEQIRRELIVRRRGDTTLW